jgi:hypothetical protein
MRLLGLIGVACAWPLLVGAAPHAFAAPDIPDIDSLIDDSGPPPKETGDFTGIPNLLFTTPSGLVCKKTVVKVMHDVTCGRSARRTRGNTRRKFGRGLRPGQWAGAVPAYSA